MFKWRKCGMVFTVSDMIPWMQEYAQCPTTIILKDRIRIFFCCRPPRDGNGNYISLSGYIEVDKKDPAKILSVADSPLLELGNTGEFDEFGSMAGTVIKHEDRYHLYYCGWTRMVSVPYNWAIGLATSIDGKHFTKYGKGPILGPTIGEPYLQACPIVNRFNDTWHMWYLSGIRWLEHSGRKESVYQIMHATSSDGIYWKREGIPIIPPVVENECQTSACVFELDNKYHMFFSYRYGEDFRNAKKGYRIGYAWSSDLNIWNREDQQAGITVSDTGWDSEMICYPHICKINNRILMFYCGNHFGRDGFGYAVLEEY